MAVIGQPISRVDGRLKVTGRAKYSAEYNLKNTAHAVLVQSSIARGRIRELNTAEAERAPGVLTVITHKNADRLGKIVDVASSGTAPGENLLPLQGDQIHYVGQHIAVIVANSLEEAEHAARLVRVTYTQETPTVEIERGQITKPEKFFGFEEAQSKRGNVEIEYTRAAKRLEHDYGTPSEHHNPIEPHATVAEWTTKNGEPYLTLYDATQAVIGSNKIFAGLFNLRDDQVQIVAKFIGGGFGCKGLVWFHPALAAMAARIVKRPVKLVLTRQQMFTSVGHRGQTVQRVALGCDSNQKFTAIKHTSTTHGSEVGDFFEPCGLTTRMMYAAPNLEVVHNVVKLNVGTPTPMRAPGESPGMFALESALDELAVELRVDPIELRLRNHADVNPHTNKVWSSKHLKECYNLGASRFGWNNRKTQPRQMRDGRFLIGYGMASATYPGYRSPASARARIMPDGTAVVSSATQDIGTGTYTVMTQIAADSLMMPVARIRFELGDSSLPVAPTSGGSQTVASVGPAVQQACELARQKLVELAIKDNRSPLYNRRAEEIEFAEGRVFIKGDSSKGESFGEIVTRTRQPMIEACVTSMTATAEAQSQADNPAVAASAQGGQNQQPGANNKNNDRGGAGAPPCSPGQVNKDTDSDGQKYAFQSFGAQFAEVGVDEDLGTVRVRRFTSVHDVGRMMNVKTARSQVYSGVIYGIGMALMEETFYDPRSGRPVTNDLADYHVPVNADVPLIDVHFIGNPDPHINALGARGIGEIGITGVAPAIANAVFNATGKRIRELPITPDKLL